MPPGLSNDVIHHAGEVIKGNPSWLLPPEIAR
jgi:hypothetical protein